MVIYSGNDCKVFVVIDGDTAIYGAAIIAAETLIEIPLINSISLDTSIELVKAGRMGSRKKCKQETGNIDDTVTLDATLTTELWTQLVAYADDENMDDFKMIIWVDADKDGAAIEAADEWIYITGALIESVELSVAQNEFVKASITLSVKQIEWDATDILTDSATQLTLTATCTAIHYKDCLFAKTAGGTWINSDDLGIDMVSSMSISMSNSVTKKWGIGSQYPYYAEAGAFEVSGSFTKDFTDWEEMAELEIVDDLKYTFGTKDIAVSDAAFGSISIGASEYELIEHEVSWEALDTTISV